MLNENLSSKISIRKQMRSASKQGQTQPGINPKTVCTKPTTVKWYIICCPFIRCQFYLSPSTSRLYDAGNLHHIASVEVRFQGWYVFRLVSIFRLQTPVWPLSQGIFQQCVRCTRQAPVGRQLCPVIRMNYAPNAVYHLKTTASHEEARKAFFLFSRGQWSSIRPAGKFAYIKSKRWGSLKSLGLLMNTILYSTTYGSWR